MKDDSALQIEAYLLIYKTLLFVNDKKAEFLI